MSNLKGLLHVLLIGVVSFSTASLIANENVNIPDTDPAAVDLRPQYPPDTDA